MSLFKRLFSRSAQKAYHRGMEAYNGGDYGAAIDALEGVLDSASKKSPIYVLSRFYVTQSRVHLGLAYLEADRLKEAHATFLEVVKHNPDFPDVHVHLGVIADKRGQWREAEMRYKRALLINPGYLEPRLLLGLLYRGRARHDDASEHFEALVEAKIDVPEDWRYGREGADDAETIERLQKAVRTSHEGVEFYHEGLKHYHEGNLEDALARFEKAVEATPDHADVLCRKGSVLAELGRFRDAVADFSRALELNHAYVEARLKRGVASFQLSRFHDAASDFQILCDADRANPETRLLLGMSLFKADRIEDSVEHLIQAATSKTSAGRAHYFLGLAYVALERPQRAIQCLEHAKLPSCRALLGRLYLEAHRIDDAIEALEDAIQGESSGDVHLTLAKAYHLAGDDARAREVAQVAAEDDRTADDAAILLCRLAFSAGDDGAALEWIHRVRLPHRDSYEVLVLKGRLLVRLEREAEAKAMLEKAVEIRPDGQDARRALGLLLRRTGEPNAAEKLLTASTQDPADALFGTDEVPELDAPWRRSA